MKSDNPSIVFGDSGRRVELKMNERAQPGTLDQMPRRFFLCLGGGLILGTKIRLKKSPMSLL